MTSRKNWGKNLTKWNSSRGYFQVGLSGSTVALTLISKFSAVLLKKSSKYSSQRNYGWVFQKNGLAHDPILKKTEKALMNFRWMSFPVIRIQFCTDHLTSTMSIDDSFSFITSTINSQIMLFLKTIQFLKIQARFQSDAFSWLASHWLAGTRRAE